MNNPFAVNDHFKRLKTNRLKTSITLALYKLKNLYFWNIKISKEKMFSIFSSGLWCLENHDVCVRIVQSRESWNKFNRKVQNRKVEFHNK